jgi:23S rRNA (guanosine2251-2'-O)-methyltransferase
MSDDDEDLPPSRFAQPLAPPAASDRAREGRPPHDRAQSDRSQGDRPPRRHDDHRDRPRFGNGPRNRAPGPRRFDDRPPRFDDRRRAPPDRPPFDRPSRRDVHREPMPHEPVAPDLVVGAHAVLALLQFQPQRVRELHIWDAHPRVRAQAIERAQAGGVHVIERPPRGLPDGNAQGVAVRVLPFAYADLDQIVPVTGAADGALVVALDCITDPRNVGAILRSAAFFGATTVVLTQDRAAEITPLVERVAEGATATLPVCRVVNLARTLQDLTQRGVEVVGTALDGATGDLRTHRWARATAIVLGAEGSGIRPLVRKRCDVVVGLPGPAAMPSLNVSAFAALALAQARWGMGTGDAGTHIGNPKSR